jgi:hypothetical protein
MPTCLWRNQAKSDLAVLATLSCVKRPAFELCIAGYANALNVIRRKLLTQAIALQSDAKLTPQADEIPDDFLKRTVRAQIDAKNWRGAYDAMKLGELGFSSFSQDDYSLIPILLSLVTAPNQEAAGQYAVVAQSYFRALKCPSTLLPANEILARLAKIKAEHPTEYKEGQFAAENPLPMQPYLPGRPGLLPAGSSNN